MAYPCCFGLFFWGLFSLVWAQVPGYEGKRNPLQLELQASPALADWVFQPEGALAANLHLNLNYEHVISRRTAIGIDAGLFQTTQNFLFQNKTGSIRLQGASIGLFAKTYRFLRKGNIAPLGPYQKWEILYLPYRIDNPETSFPNFGERRAYHDFALSFAVGTQRVFAEHFTYHLGVQTAWVFNLPANAANRQGEMDQYINQIAARRLRGFFALNLHAGIGVLLF